MTEMVESRKERPLQKLLLEEFGGWPVLDSKEDGGFKWNAANFSWQVNIFVMYIILRIG